MKFHHIVLAALLGIGVVTVSTAATAGADPTVLIVGHSSICTGTYPTISSAVAAAASGDTIQVCAGTYDETVNVPIPLNFVGAKANMKGTRKVTASKESTVSSPTGDFIIGGGASGTTINGFTLSGAGSDAITAYGILSIAGANGLTVKDNVIENNEEGINFYNADGSQPSSITYNAFIANSNGTTAEGGTGVFISNGPANNTSISYNYFSGDRQTAINFAGSTGDDSVGLTVANNKSVDDATFLVAINSDNALVSKNKVSFTGTGNGTAILDYGDNQNLRITGNTISGGADSGTSGIKLADFAGSPSVGTTVSKNKVTGRYWGIRIQAPTNPGPGYTSALVSNNTVIGSAAEGILSEAGANNVFTANHISDSSVHDCQDETTGSASFGTANTWHGNFGYSSNSSPTGIC